MNTRIYTPAAALEKAIAPHRWKWHDAGKLLASFLLQLFIISIGIFFGSIAAAILGLFLGWWEFTC